jgi:hypothetical protein
MVNSIGEAIGTGVGLGVGLGVAGLMLGGVKDLTRMTNNYWIQRGKDTWFNERIQERIDLEQVDYPKKRKGFWRLRVTSWAYGSIPVYTKYFKTRTEALFATKKYMNKHQLK